MEAENRFEYRKLKITIKTPVHIGDENTLGATEYFYDPRKGLVYFINKPEWHRFIIQHKLFNAYERYVSLQNRTQKLLSWLREQGYDLKDVQQVIKDRSFAETDSFCKSSPNNVKLHIRQADGSVYIPGSSIKGFLRTALLYRLLRTETGLKKACWYDLQSIMQESHNKNAFGNKASEKVKKLETALLHRLKLRDNNKDVKAEYAVCSVMRGLSISDARALCEPETALLQKIDIPLGGKNSRMPKELPLFRESVLPGAEFCCDLKLDKAMLRHVGIENAEQLLQAAQEFYNFTLDLWQSCDFGRAGKDALASALGGNMFLGGGSGFHTKTLIWALAPDKEEALAFTRTWLDLQFGKHRHQQLDTKLAPRILKISAWAGKKYLQGTARAEIL